MNHAITVGGLLLTLAALMFGAAAVWGFVQWLVVGMQRADGIGDDESVGPRGLRLFIFAGVLCALCIVGLFR